MRGCATWQGMLKKLPGHTSAQHVGLLLDSGVDTARCALIFC